MPSISASRSGKRPWSTTLPASKSMATGAARSALPTVAVTSLTRRLGSAVWRTARTILPPWFCSATTVAVSAPFDRLRVIGEDQIRTASATALDYDFTPVADPTVAGCLLAVSTASSGKTNSHGVTGGVYKARELIHRGMLIRDY